MADDTRDMLLTLDPSINSCGVALFDGDRLVDAGVVTHKAPKGTDMLARVLAISRGVQDWISFRWVLVYDLAAEWPDVYKPEKSEGSPRDLVPLAGVCSAVAALLAPDTVTSYFPAQVWGQVKKIKTVKDCKSSPRAKKILRRLSGDELKVWDSVKYHDTIDAIGIGLHHVGRFDRVRVFGR